MSNRDQEDGYTIFCEDIRLEASGQNTYVGVFPSNISLPQLPFTLPKFALAIYYRQPIRAPRDAVKVGVYFGEDDSSPPIIETVLDLSQAPQPPGPHREDAKVIANTNVVFSPLVIQEQTLVRVRAKVGDRTIKLGSIVVGGPEAVAE